MTSASPSGRTPPPPACTWDAPPAATAATAGAGSAEAGTTTETDTGETRPECHSVISLYLQEVPEPLPQTQVPLPQTPVQIQDSVQELLSP